MYNTAISQTLLDAPVLKGIIQDFSEFKPLNIHPIMVPTPKKTLTNEIALSNQRTDMFVEMSPTAFFCRIENAIARSSRINLKFRLGSVQYVDALEGKGYFEALSNSKATNFQLSRKNKIL
jgi:hypothetical protein